MFIYSANILCALLIAEVFASVESITGKRQTWNCLLADCVRSKLEFFIENINFLAHHLPYPLRL